MEVEAELQLQVGGRCFVRCLPPSKMWTLWIQNITRISLGWAAAPIMMLSIAAVYFYLISFCLQASGARSHDWACARQQLVLISLWLARSLSGRGPLPSSEWAIVGCNKGGQENICWGRGFGATLFPGLLSLSMAPAECYSCADLCAHPLRCPLSPFTLFF